MENYISRQLRVSKGKLLLQILAIICTFFMTSVIQHKGHRDLSLLIKEQPADLGSARGRYFIGNLAGRGPEN